MIRRRRAHPLVCDSFVSRLSGWSLPLIVGGYLALMAGCAALGALPLHLLERPAWPPGADVRSMVLEILNPGGLLGRAGQSTGFYAFAVAACLVGYLAPIFLLGAFVFKLFVRDPIVWRRTVALQDRIGLGAVLVFRFYNAGRRPLSGLTVKVYAVVETSRAPASVEHRAMSVLARGNNYVDTREWELAPPQEPFSVYVPLSVPGTHLVSSAEAAADARIDLQGFRAAKDRISFVVRVEGTDSGTGTAFMSMRTYRAAADILLGAFQSIDFDPGVPATRWSGWHNFDGAQELLLFVYDELVDTERLERLLGERATYPRPPEPAVADGWIRVWDSARPSVPPAGRVRAASAPKVFARLGLRPKAGGRCTGLLLSITLDWIDALDNRRVDCDRIEITDAFEPPAGASRRIVYAYIPNQHQRDVFDEALRTGRAAVAYDDLASVEDAFEQLGAQALADYRVQTPSPPLPVVRARMQVSAGVSKRRKALPGYVRRC